MYATGVHEMRFKDLAMARPPVALPARARRAVAAGSQRAPRALGKEETKPK